MMKDTKMPEPPGDYEPTEADLDMVVEEATGKPVKPVNLAAGIVSMRQRIAQLEAEKTKLLDCIKTVRDYARKNELGWIMGFLGEWSKSDLPDKYGVEGIPSLFLIGPDGKILAKGLRGESIKATVERTLAKADSAKAN